MPTEKGWAPNGHTMAPPATLKAKVCLVGEIAVGKTSLVRRFSVGSFDELYSTTLGISVSKKVVRVAGPPSAGPTTLEMILFDIMGQRNLRDLLVESYFKGAQALLAVWDVTRPQTLPELQGWIELAREAAGSIPLVIAANKVDLLRDDAHEVASPPPSLRVTSAGWFTTSAKTGENVEAAFQRLASELIQRKARNPARSPPSPSRGTLESVAQGLFEGEPTRPKG